MIFIVEDTEITDVLSFQEVGSSVPPETWDVLAKVFAFVLNKSMTGKKNDQT